MFSFFKNIGKSVYSPTFYGELGERSVWFSLRYYLGLVLLVATILGLGASAIFVPTLSKIIKEGLPIAETLYPKELVITIKAHEAASNVKEPYVIPLPEVMKSQSKSRATELPDNLVVIDTQKPYNADTFSVYSSAMVVNKDGFSVVADTEGGTFIPKFTPYSTDYVITHEKYVGLTKNISMLAEKFPDFAVLFFITIFFIMGISRLLLFIPIAGLIWLLLKSLSKQNTYGYAYRLAVHASTVPIVINLLLTFVLGTVRALATIPFLFTLILLATAWINLRVEVKRTEVKTEKSV